MATIIVKVVVNGKASLKYAEVDSDGDVVEIFYRESIDTSVKSLEELNRICKMIAEAKVVNISACNAKMYGVVL